MATRKDPNMLFATLEVIERLLEIRKESGYAEVLYLEHVEELTSIFDAYGFDMYALSATNRVFDYDNYTAPVVPGGFRFNLHSAGH